MTSLELSEISYDDYLEHYGTKGMKWGVRKDHKFAPIGSRIAVRSAQKEFRNATLGKHEDTKAAEKRVKQVKKQVTRENRARGMGHLKARQKAVTDSRVEKEYDKFEKVYQKHLDKASKNLDKAVQNRKDYKKYRKEFRAEEYDKMYQGLAGSPSKLAATGASFALAKYGGASIRSYNVSKAQGFSKGAAAANSLFVGPLSNVAVAEIAASSKARRKVFKG